MTVKAASIGLSWDLDDIQSVETSQRWILSAMTKHGEALVALLWRILGNEQDVCDAYQETFLKLAHNRGGRKPDHIRAFLFRSASNISISILRRKNLSGRSCRELAKYHLTAQEPDYAQTLDTQALCREMRIHIIQLPEHLRQVLILRDLAELPYNQISKILSISAATARIYRCKAVQYLAKRMTSRTKR